MVTKDELRAQVEKLERSNAMLRAKARDATRTAKADAERIAELEKDVARLERATVRNTAAQKPTATAGTPKAPLRGRGRRSATTRAPDEEIPPGVAVTDPETSDAEAETARKNLEEHLSGDA